MPKSLYTNVSGAKTKVAYRWLLIGLHGFKPQFQSHPSDPKHKEAHQCASELHSFLGVCKYWRKFSENYSDFAWPLTSLLKKDSPFLWHQNPQNWKYIEENVWQNMLCWWLLIQSSGQLNGWSRQSVWTVASPNLYTSNWAQVHRNTMAILITLHGL